MTERRNRKTRFVKCPKCGRILPESDQVLFYTCGVCSTILQAKYYRNHKEAPFPNPITDDVARGDIRGSSGSSRRTSSSDEKSSKQHKEKDKKGVDVCTSEQIEPENHALHTVSAEESSALKIEVSENHQQRENNEIDEEMEVVKEDSTSIQFQPAEEEIEFETDNVAGGSNSYRENIKTDCDSVVSSEQVSGNNITCADVNLHKEDGGETEQDDFVEDISAKLENVTLSSEETFQAQTESSSSLLLDENPEQNLLREEEASAKHDISEHNMIKQHKDNRFLSEIYEHRRYMERKRSFEAAWRKTYYHYYNNRRKLAESMFLSDNLQQTQMSRDVYNRNYWQWSAQLPSHPSRAPLAGYYRQIPMPYMNPSRETGWNPYEYGPYPTNPRRSYGWALDTTGSYLREKQRAEKRPLRPIAGGAPFITCHYCVTVVQLPEEFLICKRRLKCGACLHILEFSLENGSNLAPLVLSKDHGKGKESRKQISSEEYDREKGQQKTCLIGDDNEYPTFKSREVNVTWQRPVRSKSPLHRLMGYASPRDWWKVHTDSDRE